jgi:hypothetical protein
MTSQVPLLMVAPLGTPEVPEVEKTAASRSPVPGLLGIRKSG